MLKKAFLSICILAYLFTAAGCMTMQTPAAHQTAARGTLAHQYGEEILAYMMQVVLGQAGDPDRRATWKSRGLDQPLDLAYISKIMSEPGGNKTAIMVNDTNILGLSRVLYHYAPEISQFSGSYGTSLYPATELVALRLFMLKLLHDGRKVSVQSIVDHRPLLTNARQEPSRAQLSAMTLTREEVRLLQAAFNSKPWLFDSLTNPFLTKAFFRIGLLKKDPLTRRLIARANYRDTACTPTGRATGKNPISIAFLPSITREFVPAESGFNPTPAYLAVIESLQKGIMQACRDAAAHSAQKGPSGPAMDQLLSEKVSFQAVKTRPLVICPANAATVIRDTCPDADFVVIILGRNVYQAMHIDQHKDAYPAVPRLYLDITDVKHSQVSSEIDEIGCFVYKKLEAMAFDNRPGGVTS